MRLDAPITALKGVGPQTAEKLAVLGVQTVEDLLFFLPRKYNDFSHITPIRDIAPGNITLKAKVESVVGRYLRRRLHITEAVLDDGTSKTKAVWFNQPYRAEQLRKGEEFYFSGVYELQRSAYVLGNPSAERVADFSLSTARIVPVYSETKGLKSFKIRQIIKELIPLMQLLPETLPEQLVKRERIAAINEALQQMHFPNSSDQLARAKERLAFEEVLELMVASRLNKQDTAALQGYHIPFDKDAAVAFTKQLPFTMTNAQKKAAWEIFKDFEQATPMNRLLQGDVGSGKTVIAAMAAYMAVSAGYQAAFMAPTEILAMQHAETVAKLLEPLGVSVALLIGSIKPAAKKALQEHIAAGDVDVVIGTHALIQKGSQFHNLGLVVVDEQHRFGVQQRAELLERNPQPPHSDAAQGASAERPEAYKQYAGTAAAQIRRRASSSSYRAARKIAQQSDAPQLGNAAMCRERQQRRALPGLVGAVRGLGRMPHLLSMTATPIPRSLQLTLYGELEVSILDELPKGRQPIVTRLSSGYGRKQLYAAIDQQLDQGRQAYVVCPVIGEGEQAELKSVEAEYAKLKQSTFSHRRLAMLHGKMKGEEKDTIMRRFKAGEFDMLIATTVIEVGVDVPNATIMLIEGAERFGLAQLHQLRGRVGRGAHQSYCFVAPSPGIKPSQRLHELEKSQDGFYLAEVDLRLRGPGEIYGRMQHGALNLRIANLADTKLIKRARLSAEWLLDKNVDLLQYKQFYKHVSRYRRLTSLN